MKIRMRWEWNKTWQYGCDRTVQCSVWHILLMFPAKSHCLHFCCHSLIARPTCTATRLRFAYLSFEWLVHFISCILWLESTFLTGCKYRLTELRFVTHHQSIFTADADFDMQLTVSEHWRQQLLLENYCQSGSAARGGCVCVSGRVSMWYCW